MRVYLDNELSPRPPDEVVEFLIPFFNKKAYGSPKVPHGPGLEAYQFIQEVLEYLSSLLNSDGDFTIVGSGTEANNLALRGIIKFLGKRGNLVTSSVEHRSVLGLLEDLSQVLEVRTAPVDEDGHVRVEELERLIDRETILVSVQMVNQETGAIHDLDAISDITRDKGVLLHVDACDALGRVLIDLSKVDLLSISGSKIYGPRGVGLLYVREDLDLEPIMSGSAGIQLLTPVDVNIPALAGFHKALQLFGSPEKWEEVKRMRDRISRELEGTDVVMNSPPDSVDTINFSVREGAGALILEASSRGLYMSQGTSEPVSYVLTAMGRTKELAANSLMLKLHPYMKWREVDFTIEVLSDLLG
ncbi:MAG: aminotransferase class V-fold PLP-dependent enzyme [Candidatus Korarchaeota archaeon]|nr:aminotransferase class V-fold PLP-dependent enzyme [Candidatus Korarchaeota archaeon]